jgi:secretion/DNA translocation related CpaE-like protein
LAWAGLGGRVCPRGWTMGVRIGLVGQRADLAVEVAALAARAGASVVSLGPAEVVHAGHMPQVQVDLVLLDVAVVGAEASGEQDGLPGVPAWVDRIGGDPAPREQWWGSSPDTRAGVHPGGVPVVVLCRPGEGQWAREAAVAAGCAHVVELPLGAPWLLSQLAPDRGSAVLGIVGAVGGVGATTIAIGCAVGAGPDCLLVDADPDSSGLDLPLGIPEGAGVRWSEIPDTPDPLDPVSLRSALPQVGGLTVVTGSGIGSGLASGDGPGTLPGPGRVAGVLGVGRAEFTRTVVDAGRGRLPAGVLGPGDPVVLVLPATLAGVVAGRRALDGLAARQVVVLLRPTGWLPPADVAEQLGVPVAFEVPRLRRAAELADCGDLLSGRTGRALRTLGEQVWGQLA